VDHSSNMPEPVATTSAEAEYNKTYMLCMTTSHMHMTLNHMKEGKDESKEDTPIDIYIYIYMDNRSAVGMITTFKDPSNARIAHGIFNAKEIHDDLSLHWKFEPRRLSFFVGDELVSHSVSC
jgi:hypothetical protein